MRFEVDQPFEIGDLSLEISGAGLMPTTSGVLFNATVERFDLATFRVSWSEGVFVLRRIDEILPSESKSFVERHFPLFKHWPEDMEHKISETRRRDLLLDSYFWTMAFGGNSTTAKAMLEEERNASPVGILGRVVLMRYFDGRYWAVFIHAKRKLFAWSSTTSHEEAKIAAQVPHLNAGKLSDGVMEARQREIVDQVLAEFAKAGWPVV